MINWQPGITIDDVEKQVIEKALRWFNGNKTKTAQSLGIAVRTLDNKLAKYQEQANGKEAAANSIHRLPTGSQGSIQAKGWLHVEPSAEVPEKRAVPMRKQQKV